jgi:DNA-binding NarL/FixJ family response regulator
VDPDHPGSLVTPEVALTIRTLAPLLDEQGAGPGSGPSVIRLLIADDHPLVRFGLTDLFTATEDVRIVAECTDGDEVLDAALRTRPDVALLDLRMPRLGGLEAAELLLDALPGIRVVIFTGTDSLESAHRARALGVAGFLLKGHRPDELAQRIRAVAAGSTVWDVDLGDRS